MKKKISRLLLALVLALSLSMVMAVPVMATHTSGADIAFDGSTVAGEASILNVTVTNDGASAGDINKVEIDFTLSDFTVTGAGTATNDWSGVLVGTVVTYTPGAGDMIPDASVTFSPTVTNPEDPGPAVVPAVKTTDTGSAAKLAAGENTGWIAYEAVGVGTGGNLITVAYVDPAMGSQPLSVSVAGKAITVNLATDVDAVLISMAFQVADVINGDDPGAADLVDAIVADGHDDDVVGEATVQLTGGTNRDVDKACTVSPATLPVTPSFTVTATADDYRSAAVTSYEISFTTLQPIVADTGTIKITFPGAYVITALVVAEDVSMTVDGGDYTPKTVELVSQVVTITAHATIEIPVDSAVVITFANDHIGNPATSGLYNITVQATGTDTASDTVTIVPASFKVEPVTVTAGTPFAVTVTAQNALGDTDTGYGDVHFIDFTSTASEPKTIPAYEPITFDKGVGTSSPANFILTVAGEAEVTITATDAVLGVSGESETIIIKPQVFSELTIAGEPGTVIAGENFGTNDITVTALNADGEIVTDYTRKVTWTSSDPNPTLPGEYTFTTGDADEDNGTHTFLGSFFTLKTVGDGTQTITVTDNEGVSKISALITVTPATASQWTVVRAPTSITADGTDSSTITATVKDTFGNVDTEYSGTATFTTNLGDITTSGAMNFTDGVVENTLTSDGVVGKATIRVTSRVTSGTLLDKIVTVTLVAPSLLTEVWVEDVTDVPWLNDPTHFGNISDAISDVADGGTVNVAAGTYEEAVFIDKSLTLLGAKAGVDARTRSGASESIIVGTPTEAFTIAANNVIIDGFTIQGVTSGFKGGIDLSGSHSGYQIENNIIQDNELGIRLRSEGTTQTVIQHNLFKDNDQGGEGIARAIDSRLKSGESDGATKKVLIDSNKFTGHVEGGESSAINLTHSVRQEVITISNNEFSDDSSVVVVDASTVEVTGNTFSMTTGSGTGIYVGGLVDGITITQNSFSNAPGWAIQVTTVFGGENTGVEVNYNNFTNSTTGALNVAQDGNVVAEYNWWGDASGPTYADNPAGTGDAVSDKVDYSPWLTSEYTEPVAPATTIDLEVGWNLISLPLIPEVPAIETMLTDLEVAAVSYYTGGPEGTWQLYSGAPSDLTTMNDGKGYWMDMNAAGELVFEGWELVAETDPPSVPPSYAVVEGWNLIGFKSTTPMTPAVYLGTLVDSTLEAIYGYNASTRVYFIPDNLQPSYGYWLAVNADGTIYP